MLFYACILGPLQGQERGSPNWMSRLIYTRRVDDPAEYDPLFTQALSARLAADLVMPLQGDRETWRLADNAFVAVMDAARTADSRALTPASSGDAAWIVERG